ncbi:MAG: preprotein translocase subunit SecE [Deltaproteobacteria bacterium]|nr:preprotein translocase subunit SecE [Deltaproteobacteria bacterium]MBI3076563.1 preprotein translocase subunit SecE [Deltaproteobacteria bacterium]
MAIAVRETIDRAVGFFKEAQAELKKVTWPVRKELYASTVVVLVTVLIVAFFLSFVDFALTRLTKAFMQ